jgi:hypothetical protein
MMSNYVEVADYLPIRDLAMRGRRLDSKIPTKNGDRIYSLTDCAEAQ